MHYHVTRTDHNTRTWQPADRVGVAVVQSYAEVSVAIVADSAQFRLPKSPRYVLHNWNWRPCEVEHQ